MRKPKLSRKRTEDNSKDVLQDNLPKARSWLNFPFYLFMKYPHLRPEDDSGLTVFHKLTLAAEQRLTGIPQIHSRLSTPQLKLLSALVVDWDSHYETWNNKKTLLKGLQKEIRRSLAFQAGISKRVKEVRKAALSLRRYVDNAISLSRTPIEVTLKPLETKLDQLFIKHSSDETKLRIKDVHNALLILEQGFGSPSYADLSIANGVECDACVLTSVEFEELSKVRDTVKNYKSSEGCDPLLPATHALHDFFVRECGFSKADSEIFTARIGNHLWRWGIDIQKDFGRGSSAVRLRIRRYLKTTKI